MDCLTPQQHSSVSQGRICSDKCTYCHTEMEVADQTLCLAQSQCTDTGPTRPCADRITPGAWHGSHWSANFEVTGMTRTGKIPTAQAGIEPQIFYSRVGLLNHYADEAVLAFGSKHALSLCRYRLRFSKSSYAFFVLGKAYITLSYNFPLE